MEDILFSVDNATRGVENNTPDEIGFISLLENPNSDELLRPADLLFPNLHLLRDAVVTPRSGSLISKIGGRFDRKDMIDSLISESFNFLQVDNHPDMRVYLFSRLFMGREEAANVAAPAHSEYLPSTVFEALSTALGVQVQSDRDLLGFVKKNLSRYPSFQRALFELLAKYVHR